MVYRSQQMALFSLIVSMGSALCAQTAEFKGCHASWNESELVLSNTHFSRSWRLNSGLLTATSFRNLHTGTEWIRQASLTPAPVPANCPSETRNITVTTRTGQLAVTQQESLEVVLVAQGKVTLTYRFRLFPDAAGVETQLETNNLTPSAPTAKSPAAATVSGLEFEKAAETKPAGDALEDLLIAQRHLRLTQVTLMDRTDGANELVQENEWMLLKERNLTLAGNLFALENPITGEGLVFLKLAPLPHARTVKSSFDCQMLTARQIRFVGQGYPFTLLAYSGGRAGRTAVLHEFQRQLRRYQPERDGQFLTNTWGDRSQDGKVSEAFMLREVEAAGRLGVDVVQIDDGWQKGASGNSAVSKNGAWGSFWAHGEDFWQPHPERFPRGLKPIVEALDKQHMKLGIWYGPDSANGGSNWTRDAQRLLSLYRDEGVCYFKLDAVDISVPGAAGHFRQLLDELLNTSQGRIAIDLDVTAGTRPGYFGAPDCGPIFVENRYTDSMSYWPHLTLRNLWKLSHYVDPLRLRMEFLNATRNRARYGSDPLAPGNYAPDTLFATVMFANPLGFFESSNLPADYLKSVAEMVAVWKKERTAMYQGRILPIGEAPDGLAWTGFASMAQKASYVLAFRELNASEDWSMDLPGLSAHHQVQVLAGKGQATLKANRLEVHIPQTLGYLWLRVE